MLSLKKKKNSLINKFVEPASINGHKRKPTKLLLEVVRGQLNISGGLGIRFGIMQCLPVDFFHACF